MHAITNQSANVFALNFAASLICQGAAAPPLDNALFSLVHFWAIQSSIRQQLSRSQAADLGRPVMLPVMSMTKPDLSVG